MKKNYSNKIVAGFLAMMLLFAMSIAVFAVEGGTQTGTITIESPVKGQTYTIYKIFDLESYVKGGAYAYKLNNVWKEFITSSASDYVKVDDGDYVTWLKNDGEGNPVDVDKFAEAALEYAKANKIDNQGEVTMSDADSKVEFTNLELGYYLVDTSLGALCGLNTTDPAVTIREKNEAPSVDKKVKEKNYGDANDAYIGQVIEFQVTIHAKPGAQNYVLHDTMTNGLTFGEVTSVAANGEALTKDTHYTVSSEIADGDGCTFHVSFEKSYLDTITRATDIVISYTATLNEDAFIGKPEADGEGNTNKAFLGYGDNNRTDETDGTTTTTNVWELPIYKFTNDNGIEKPLAGAVFTLSQNNDGTNPLAFIEKGENVYRLAITGEIGAVTEFTTDDTGMFVLQGLDSGTYYLTETTAPQGYNKLTAPKEIVLNSNGMFTSSGTISGTGKVAVKVENKSGSLLPDTGSIGVKIFYIVGGIAAVSSGIILIVRKRTSKRTSIGN